MKAMKELVNNCQKLVKDVACLVVRVDCSRGWYHYRSFTPSIGVVGGPVHRVVQGPGL